MNVSGRIRAATKTVRALGCCALLVPLLCGAAESERADELPFVTHYRRVEQRLQVPDAILTDPTGKSYSLAQELGAEGPVVLNFISTDGCPDACVATPRAFAELQERPAVMRRGVRLISIALDPRHDSPARLRAWAHQMGAGPGWMVLTGSRRELAPVLQAFGASEDAKAPATFLHAGPRAAWVRLEGPVSAADLAGELH